jgi:hypothetical protein
MLTLARSIKYRLTSKLARANSAARFDKIILIYIYDLLFIYLKSLTLNLHVDIGVTILKLVLVHPNFVVWVWSWIGGWKSNSEWHNQCFTAPSHTLQALQLCILDWNRKSPSLASLGPSTNLSLPISFLLLLTELCLSDPADSESDLGIDLV